VFFCFLFPFFPPFSFHLLFYIFSVSILLFLPFASLSLTQICLSDLFFFFPSPTPPLSDCPHLPPVSFPPPAHFGPRSHQSSEQGFFTDRRPPPRAHSKKLGAQNSVFCLQFQKPSSVFGGAVPPSFPRNTPGPRVGRASFYLFLCAGTLGARRLFFVVVCLRF